MIIAEPLTKADAANLARESLAQNLSISAKPFGYSQARVLVDQIAILCADETLRLGGTQSDLYNLVNTAWEVIHAAWSAGAPEVAKRFRWGENKPTEDEQKNIDRAHNVIWTRHDPKRAFQEGYESSHHVDNNKEIIAESVALYLQNKWLRHPFLDWTFVDITVSSELCAFGEVLKQQRLPGKRDMLGFNDRYIESKGNLAKMTEVRWKELAERFWTKTFWFLLVPVAAIWFAFHSNWIGTGVALLALYSLVITARLAVGIARWGKRALNKILGHPDPRSKAFFLWDEMYDVWRRLEGPVVNPSLVREAMVKSSQQGAVWDTVTWSLIDRAIAIDPAVWIIQPNTI
jgi:hypothetical protein